MRAGGIGNNALVTITKTRKWFDDRQSVLEQYKTEVNRLTDQFGRKTDSGDRKRARQE